MADILWLASYPKSGNTWVRALLTNYIRNGSEPADFNAIGRHMKGAFSRALFDSYSALKSTDLSPNVVTRLRPEVVRSMAACASERLFLKVHDAWQYTDRGEPLFPSDCSFGALYIVRNVLDVAASLANHLGIDVPGAVQRLCRPDFTLASGRKSLLLGLPQFLGSWSHHVTSWIDQSPFTPLVVRYEDLQADTIATLRNIVQFAGLEVSSDRLAQAAQYSRFDVLKNMESAHGFVERPHIECDNFFRKGKVGGWREELTPDLAGRLIDVHGDVMRRFGYLTASGEPL